MNLAYRNVGGLVFRDQIGIVAVGDFGRAADHNPVFCPVVVHLDRQLGAGLHGDAFHLVAVAVIDRIIYTPGPVNFPVVHVLVSTITFDAFNDLFDILDLIFVGDEQGVFGFNNHQVLYPDGCNQSAFRPYQGALGIVSYDVAAKAVAVSVFLRHVPECRPRADIAPAGIEHDHGSVIRLFHHGVIYGFFRALGEYAFIHAGEVQILAGVIHRSLADGENVRAVFLQFLKVGAGAEKEHAAVPEVITGCEVFFRSCLVGLLYKPADAETVVGQYWALLNVAVSGFRMTGYYAESHQLILLSQGHGLLDAALERSDVLDQVVCGQDQHQRVLVFIDVFNHFQCCQSDGRCRVARTGLQDNSGIFVARLAHLLSRQKSVLFVADQEWVGRRHAVQPGYGQLQHG